MGPDDRSATREATIAAGDAWHNHNMISQLVIVLLLFTVLVGAGAFAYENHKLERRTDALEDHLAHTPNMLWVFDSMRPFGHVGSR